MAVDFLTVLTRATRITEPVPDADAGTAKIQPGMVTTKDANGKTVAAPEALIAANNGLAHIAESGTDHKDAEATTGIVIVYGHLRVATDQFDPAGTYAYGTRLEMSATAGVVQPVSTGTPLDGWFALGPPVDGKLKIEIK